MLIKQCDEESNATIVNGSSSMNESSNNNNQSKEQEAKQKPAATKPISTQILYAAYEGDERHGKYWRSLQTCKPIRNHKRKLPAPIDNANLFSYLTFGWLTKVVFKSRKPLVIEDLPPLSKYDAADHATKRLTRIYNEDAAKHDGVPSIKRTVFRFIRTRILVSAIAACLSVTSALLGPGLLVNRLVSFADLESPGLAYGIGLALGLMVTEFGRSLSFSLYWGINYRTAIRARAAVLTMVFQKIARLRSLKNKSVGELVNLLTNDGQRLAEMIMFGGILLGAPVMLLGVTLITCMFVGWTALIGVVSFTLFIPFQMVLAKLMAKFRRQSIVVTDTRVRMMNEILTCVKLIKMYAWEESFAKSIDKIRKEERRILTKSGFIQSYEVSLIPVVPVVSTVLLFLVHTLLGYPLDASAAFSVVSVFNSMRFVVAILPLAVRALSEVYVSFGRIDDLLLMEEMQEYYGPTSSKDVAIEFTNLTSMWDVVEKTNEGKASKPSSENRNKETGETVCDPYQDVLFDINLMVPKKRLIGICGSVGSGKSSLISTILGQTVIKRGKLGLNGTFAYVPQQAWIFHSSVRENITFGAAWDEEKYNKVIENCSLRADFEILPDKDLTEVGERGINLSGGQKQRISMARAVYSDRDIILLDDPLSAVDAHVGKHIFFECIKTALADKTVIFVTHQLQYLKDCDEVILLKDGRIAEHGSHDQLVANNQDYSELIKNFYLEQEKERKSQEQADTKLAKALKQKRSLSAGSILDSVTQVKDRELLAVSSLTSAPSPGNRSPRHFRRLLTVRSADTLQVEGGVPQEKPEHDLDVKPDQTSAHRLSGNLPKKHLSSVDEQDPIVLVQSESSKEGSVSKGTYLAYMRAAGGYLFSFVVGMAFVLTLFGATLSNWWLSYWIGLGGAVIPCNSVNATESEGDKSDELLSGISANACERIQASVVALGSVFAGTTATTVNFTSSELNQTESALLCEVRRSSDISTGENREFYQVIYFVILIGTLLVALTKAALFTRCTIGSASNLHNSMFRRVFNSPMSFFDTTPTGRILNRFSRDLDDVDVRLPLYMDMFLQQMLLLSFALVTIIVVFPWFTFAVVVLAVIFGVIYVVFRSAIRELKRLDNTTRSPWFSHVTSTVQGLTTIHAYEKTDDVIEKFGILLDNNTSPFFSYLCAGRWLSVRLDALTITITVIIAIFVVCSTIYKEAFGNTNAAEAGLALSYAITMTGLFQVCVRFSVELESYFTSVERINEYIQTCPSETNEEEELDTVAESWPEKGEIRFYNASLRYRPNLPLVLKNVNFIIYPREKIGIVGRTGSGKSSLGTALFRLVKLASGEIRIDKVNVGKINLQDLRRNLSIIPQDPVLFVGTVRYNLDPFNKYTDDEIWTSLERTHMKKAISELPEKLQSEVVENGENFSVGERQLLCMARAILRHSRIIMLDEATAAIDSETDSLVQDTIREAFSDCTMLTIAHRLNTVLACDKILVMEEGKVVEFDKPSVLLTNANSHFSKMLEAAANVQEEKKIKDPLCYPSFSSTKFGLTESQHPQEYTNIAFENEDEKSNLTVVTVTSEEENLDTTAPKDS